MPGVAKIWTIFLHYFDILWRGVGRDFDEIWVVLYHAEFLAKFTSRKCSGLMITDDDTKLLYQQIAHLIVQIWADQKSSINNGGRIIIKLKMKVIVRPCRISILQCRIYQEMSNHCIAYTTTTVYFWDIIGSHVIYRIMRGIRGTTAGCVYNR